MTRFTENLDHAHCSAPADELICIKSLIMNHHISFRKNKAIEVRSSAAVVPLRITGEKKGKRHEITVNKFNHELPLHHNERIFKAKKHDTL